MAIGDGHGWMIFIRRRGLQNLNRERPACLPYHQYIQGVQYFIYSHSFHLAVQRREALWCLIGVGLWRRMLRSLPYASGPLVFPFIWELQSVLWHSVSFRTALRLQMDSGSGIHLRAGHCVCKCILEVVVCCAIVWSAVVCDWCFIVAEDSEKCVYVADPTNSKVKTISL